MDKRDLDNELDMLRGNINRMCVCEEKEELYIQFYWATRRCAKILDICEKRFEQDK